MPYVTKERQEDALRSYFHDETREWLAANLPEAEWFDVSGSPYAYCELLQRLWRETDDDLLIIEHDHLPTLEEVERMRTCTEEWCSAGYTIGGPNACYFGLGFTRFRKELLQREDDVMDVAARIDDDGVEMRHWVRMDSRVLRTLHQRKSPVTGELYEPCPHGVIQHLHYYEPWPVLEIEE